MARPAHIDIEVLPNYFLVGITNEAGDKYVAYEQYDGHPLNCDALACILAHPELEFYSFNGANYDLPLIRLALQRVSCKAIKRASDVIIEEQLKGWQVGDRFSQADIQINHVDLIEVAPGMNGLKTYGGRLHAKRLQDMPLAHDAVVSRDQHEMIRQYNRNDLDLTRELRLALAGQIDLRRELMRQMQRELDEAQMYGYTVDDLRSKSDAQIAESVLRQRVTIATGVRPRKSTVPAAPFKYKPPSYIQFRTRRLQQVLATVAGATFKIKPSGHVEMPAEIDNLDIEINGTAYKLGIGGLHSQESCTAVRADDDHLLMDIDVTSYYPNLMLNMGMYPPALGESFLRAYRDILDERVAAKRAGDKVKDAVLKITLNGTFGKTSSRYSILYNPQMMLYTTMTGQLAVLMLIEYFERAGIHVVSANTDGIVVHYHKDHEPMRKRIVAAWQQATNLSTDETRYVALHSRDVNSYFAVKPDGSIKRKGAYASLTLAKSPNAEICADAVAQHLTTGEPIDEYILACTDIRKFLVLRRVTGGAHKDGVEIGKVIRWYYSTDVRGTIRYVTNDKIVGSSAGARPLMELPDEFPQDVDYDWYIAEAREILCDIGLAERKPRPKLPRRGSKQWAALESDGLVGLDDYGKPSWLVREELIPQAYKLPND